LKVIHSERVMKKFVATYQRGRTVDLGWIVTHGRVTAAEVHAAVARGELPPPSPNAVVGALTWDREEARRWIENRGVRKILRA
jgi:hypothetical protein